MQIRSFPSNSPTRAMRKVARQYAAAIIRRGRQATDHTFLADVWAMYGAEFIRDGKNYIVLKSLADTGWYVASHFAPCTLMGGYRLIKKAREADLPIIFTVPEDLALNLERLGWKRIPEWARRLVPGLPEDKVVLLPAGMMGRAWKIVRDFAWNNLYGQGDNSWIADCPRGRKKPRGIKRAPKKPVTLADFWPESGRFWQA